MFTLTVLEILLFEDKLVLWPAQHVTGSERVIWKAQHNNRWSVLIHMTVISTIIERTGSLAYFDENDYYFQD